MLKNEFMDWLNAVEATFPVADWRVDNIRVWPILRLNLFALNFNATVTGEGAPSGWKDRVEAAREVFAQWARAVIVDRAHNIRPDTPADAVFLTMSLGIQPTVEGRRINQYLAPYVDLLNQTGRRATVWEMCPYGQYNIPRLHPSFYIQPWLLRERMYSQFAHPTAAMVLPKYGESIQHTEQSALRFWYRDYRLLQRDIYFVRRLADRFKKWLSKSRPTIGFTADYSLRENAFCLACRELGILAVDLQHGVQSDIHPAYGRWSNVPAHGYETSPHVYWNWDTSSASAIDRWIKPDQQFPRSLLGGHGWQEMWQNPHNPAAAEVGAAIRARKHHMNARKHILVTLSSVGDLLPDALRDFIARAPQDWCFWPRLHPVNQKVRLPQAQQLFRELAVTAVDVEYATQLPLPILLQHVDLHVTSGWSTVIAEADDYGVSSIACLPRAGEVFPEHVARGVLTIRTKSDELLSAAHQYLNVTLQNRTSGPLRSPGAMRELLALAEDFRQGSFPRPAMAPDV